VTGRQVVGVPEVPDQVRLVRKAGLDRDVAKASATAHHATDSLQPSHNRITVRAGARLARNCRARVGIALHADRKLVDRITKDASLTGCGLKLDGLDLAVDETQCDFAVDQLQGGVAEQLAALAFKRPDVGLRTFRGNAFEIVAIGDDLGGDALLFSDELEQNLEHFAGGSGPFR
jgi:hypothetical protein